MILPTVQDVTTVLATYFPAQMPAARALMVLSGLMAAYPILRHHYFQRQLPRQPYKTGWAKSSRQLLEDLYHEQIPGQEDAPEEETWENDSFLNDILPIMQFLYPRADLPTDNITNPFTVDPPIILCTSRGYCKRCPDNPLRQRLPPKSIRVITENYKSKRALLVIGHCHICKSDYFPDRITFKNPGSIRMQKLECDTEYYRISHHGIWAHRQLGISQEHMVNHMRATWSSFANWLNTTHGPSIITLRQAYRLFVEHFLRRLVNAHEINDTFTIPAECNTQTMVKEALAFFGKGGGRAPGAMFHVCQDCTHEKRYVDVMLSVDHNDHGVVEGDFTDTNIVGIFLQVLYGY